MTWSVVVVVTVLSAIAGWLAGQRRERNRCNSLCDEALKMRLSPSTKWVASAIRNGTSRLGPSHDFDVGDTEPARRAVVAARLLAEADTHQDAAVRLHGSVISILNAVGGRAVTKDGDSFLVFELGGETGYTIKVYDLERVTHENAANRIKELDRCIDDELFAEERCRKAAARALGIEL